MIYKLQTGRIVPLGGDYLEYLQSIPETYGGSIQPSVKIESLPKKFNGSQKAARTYAEGYQKGAKPVTKAIDNAGQKIFNTTKNVAMFVPGPTGAITWLGQMGADTANGEYSKVAKDLGAAVLIGAGLKGVQIGAKAAGRALAGKGVNIPWLDAYDYSALRNEYFNKTTMKGSSNVPITIENIPDSHQMFRASIYKGGNIKDPYFSFFTTDPEYARQYGPVNKYILEQKGPVAIAKEPMIGSRDVATNDMFIDRNTRDVPGAKIILGHDLVTPDIPIKSKGLEILSFNKPSLLKPIVSPQEAATTYHWDPETKVMSRPISIAEKLGLPKGERNLKIKPNPKGGETTSVDTYLINRSHKPWQSDGESFVFKFGEPLESFWEKGSFKHPLSIHFTTDLAVKPHSSNDSWALADDTFLIPYKSVVQNNGHPSNIDPMDTWFTGNSTFKIPTKGVKILTANPKNYRMYKAQGLDVEYSPESRKAILAEDNEGNRTIVDQWIRKVQEETGMRPTIDTYRQMEKETGLTSGVEEVVNNPSKIVSYYSGPTTHQGQWHAGSMHAVPEGQPDPLDLSELDSWGRQMSNKTFNPGYEDYWATVFERDLPALQKVVQMRKDFSKRMPKYLVDLEQDVTPGYSYARLNNYWKNSSIEDLQREMQYDWKLMEPIPIEPLDYGQYRSLIDKADRILKGEILYKKQGGKLK